MIDEKKIEEAAKECRFNTIAQMHSISFAHKATVFREEVDLETELIENAFIAGIDWFKDNLLHDASEESEQDKVVLIQLKEDGSWHTAIFVGIEFRIIDMKQEDEYLVSTDDTTRWLYIEDLMKGVK